MQRQSAGGRDRHPASTRFSVEMLEQRRMLSAVSTSGPEPSVLTASQAAGVPVATVTIANGSVGLPGATVNVPITISGAATLQALDFVIRYDTSRLNLGNSNITLGGLLSGWTLTRSVNDALGTAVISAFTTVPLVAGTGTLFNLAFQVDTAAVSGVATIALPAPDNEFSLNEGAIGMLVAQGGITVNAAGPTVSKVVVGSSSWTDPFSNYLVAQGLGSSNGYTIPFGASQTQSLPWTNLNKISIVFGEGVNVSVDDLQVYGVSASYSVIDLSYNSSTHTATWTLGQPVANDKLLLRLSESVTDAFGKALDGDWSTHQQGPSGNGDSGGDFLFEINVLRGDANGDGKVDGADYTLWADNFASAGPLTSHRGDFNGSGLIDGADYTVWADNYLLSLPPGTPSVPALAPLPVSAAAAATIAEYWDTADTAPIAAPTEPSTSTSSLRSFDVPERKSVYDQATPSSPYSAADRTRAQLAWAKLVDHFAFSPLRKVNKPSQALLPQHWTD